jgi:hypothetical protein
LTVRIDVVRIRAATPTRPPHPASTSVTIAKRLSSMRRNEPRQPQVLKNRIIISQQGWTEMIALNANMKLIFTRKAFLLPAERI